MIGASKLVNSDGISKRFERILEKSVGFRVANNKKIACFYSKRGNETWIEFNDSIKNAVSKYYGIPAARLAKPGELTFTKPEEVSLIAKLFPS